MIRRALFWWCVIAALLLAARDSFGRPFPQSAAENPGNSADLRVRSVDLDGLFSGGGSGGDPAANQRQNRGGDCLLIRVRHRAGRHPILAATAIRGAKDFRACPPLP